MNQLEEACSLLLPLANRMPNGVRVILDDGQPGRPELLAGMIAILLMGLDLIREPMDAASLNRLER